MAGVSGDFEIHLTVWEHSAGKLAAFAQRHGLKYSHVVLDRGQHTSQPMLTVRGSGTLAEQHELARRWCAELSTADLHPIRVKVEAAPWNVGVPQTDAATAADPPERYFEHHVKLLLPDAGIERLVALTELVTAHDARLSRNIRRRRADGRAERFVTQRCRQVGRPIARQRLEALLDALRGAGHEAVEVEEEYVVADSAVRLDSGWLEPAWVGMAAREDQMRSAPAGATGYPATYRPLPAAADIRQRAAFDPAMRQFPNAYRAGEPEFTDAAAGRRWRAARRAAMDHVLKLVATSPWAEHLVLRGSVPLRAWLGDAAREPGDLDFVVTPHTLSVTEPRATDLLDGLVGAVGERPGAGLRTDKVALEDIWTYERAPGRRLVFPFVVPSLPPGTVQLDFVFNEKLPLPPVPVRLPPLDTPVLTATPELSLAWKLLWLETDIYPQGKDLYDAVLLAEYTQVSPDLVREVLRPELGADADSFGPETVLAWSVDWQNFCDEYPRVGGDVASWQHRLALALDRSFAEPRG